jgi:hypothetical protein
VVEVRVVVAMMVMMTTEGVVVVVRRVGFGVGYRRIRIPAGRKGWVLLEVAAAAGEGGLVCGGCRRRGMLGGFGIWGGGRLRCRRRLGRVEVNKSGIGGSALVSCLSSSLAVYEEVFTTFC